MKEHPERPSHDEPSSSPFAFAYLRWALKVAPPTRLAVGVGALMAVAAMGVSFSGRLDVAIFVTIFVLVMSALFSALKGTGLATVFRPALLFVTWTTLFHVNFFALSLIAERFTFSIVQVVRVLNSIDPPVRQAPQTPPKPPTPTPTPTPPPALATPSVVPEPTGGRAPAPKRPQFRAAPSQVAGVRPPDTVPTLPGKPVLAVGFRVPDVGSPEIDTQALRDIMRGAATKDGATIAPPVDRQTARHARARLDQEPLGHPWWTVLAGIEGRVRVVAQIDPRGRVSQVRTLKTDVTGASPTTKLQASREFERAAVAHVKTFRYAPVSEGVTERVLVVVNFTVSEDMKPQLAEMRDHLPASPIPTSDAKCLLGDPRSPGIYLQPGQACPSTTR